MCCFTYHVSLCLLEPTGNLQIMETQFHNSLIHLWAKTTANLHALFKLTVRVLKPGHLEEDGPITMFSENKILEFFFSRAVQQHPSIWRLFPKRQVSSNSFKNFIGCIVEYLNFIGLSTKTLENILFWENIVIGQSSSKCPGLSGPHCNVLV